MRVALIHGKYFNSWEALGLGYIGAYIERHRPEVEVCFFQGCFDSDEEILKGAAECDVVAFSCTTPTFPHARSLAQQLKAIRPSTRTVIGGYHPSALPTSCVQTEFDHVVVGEGESAMVDILAGCQQRLIQARTMSFDELPWPDRQLIRNERNIEVAFNDTGKRITSFQSHRACPFMCKYCLDGYNKVLYGNVRKAPMRYRPVGDLLSEIAHVTEKFSLDLIKFSDPTWNTDVQWVIDFCREKAARGVDVPFYPNMHATICTREMIQLMAAANCYEIAVGIESGSPKILKQIGKGTTVDTIRRCVDWAKEAGILVRGYFILGMPAETEEDLRLTAQFAEELELDEYGFTILCPYPGTTMYDPATMQDVDWALADEYSNDFWSTQTVSNERLKEWQTRLATQFGRKLTWHNKMLAADGAGPAATR